MSDITNNYCIELKDVVYQYRGDLEPMLEIPGWSVNHGSKLFLRGESGSGKSTLIHILAGLLEPTLGNIKINGFDLSSASVQKRDQFRANYIGLVYQQFNLIPYLSMLDNVMLASHFAKTKNSQTKELAESLLNKMSLPQELHNKDSRHLSIGQQQRVAICRAMINQPNLVLVDEPTSALDSNNRDRFMSLLFDLLDEYQATLIFVSHDETLATRFTEVIELNELNTANNYSVNQI